MLSSLTGGLSEFLSEKKEMKKSSIENTSFYFVLWAQITWKNNKIAIKKDKFIFIKWTQTSSLHLIANVTPEMLIHRLLN